MGAKRVIKLGDISRKDFSVEMGKLSVKTSSAIARSNDGSGNLVLFNPSDPLAGWVMPANIKDKGTIHVQFSNGIAAFEYISNIWYFRFFQPNAANAVIISADPDNSITPGSDGGAFFDASGLGGGGGAVSSVTGTLPAGKTIATHNNGIGGSTIIRETVTTLVVAGQDGTYTNENGVTSTFKQAIQYNTGEVRNASVGDPALVIQAGAVVEAKIGAGAVTESKIGTGAVTNAKLGTAAAHTIKTNNTASTASPGDLVINEQELVGRGTGGNIDGITLDSNLSISGGQLQFVGGGITSILYSALATLISTNALVVNRRYLITDYQTVHTVPGTSDTNTASVEPLIVTATSVNTLAPIAYSTTHPGDLIFYKISNADTSKVQGQTKGFIDRRIDTVNNIDVPFDFRNVKFRRWEINVTNAWDIGTTYNDTAVVRTSNGIYMSMINSNTGNDPDLDTYHWMKFAFANATYVSHTPTQITLAGHNIPVSANFQDRLINASKNTIIKYGSSSGTSTRIDNFNLIFNTQSVNTNINVIQASGTIDDISETDIKTRVLVGSYFGFMLSSTINNEQISQLFIAELDDCHINGNLVSSSIKSMSKTSITASSAISYLTINYSGGGQKFIYNTFNGQTSSIEILYNTETFRFTTIKDLASAASATSFLAATRVFANYTKDIVRDSAGVAKLLYLNDLTSNVTAVAINA